MKKLLFIVALLLSVCCSAHNSHFWDGIEEFDGPTDENPVLASQLDFYFDKLVAPLPDSITKEINGLVERTSSNTDLRDFILWHLLERYRHPEYMTQDQVFVFLYDKYFSKLPIRDLYETNLQLIREKAERLRRLALFNKAPDIRIGDVDLLSNESDYTIVFLYDHDCDLCHQERQELDSVVAVHPEVTVVAIDMNTEDPSVNALYDLYDIEATPLIYVLDREKRIIGKKIRARQIPLIL